MIHPHHFAGIRLARLEFTLEMLEPVPLEGFIGPTLRGFLGKALHDISLTEAGAPAFAGRSLYFDVFEPPTRENGGGTPPYVLHPPPRPLAGLARGDVLSFGLTLFGEAVDRAIPLIWALFRHGLAHGLTQQGRRVQLLEVMTVSPLGPIPLFHALRGPVPEAWDPAWTWSADALVAAQCLSGQRPPARADAGGLELEFLTPLDLREKQVAVEPLEFESLVRSLLRNASSHAEQHGGAPLALDFQGIVAAAREVRLEADDSRLVAVEHVSGRQGRRIAVDARVGRLRYDGPVAPFAPLLTLGATLHAGKGRSMGFGGIRWRWVEG